MTTRRGFLKGIMGAGAAVAVNKVAPELVELKCKGCGGVLTSAGDYFECTSCGSRYALGGVVMQEEEDVEPEKKMFDVHRFQETTCYYPLATSASAWYGEAPSMTCKFDNQGRVVPA